MFQRLEEEKRIIELRKKFTTAKDARKDTCIKCGFCCHRRPCIPTPAEVRIIARYLKITPSALINEFCTIDKRNDDYDNTTYFVKPMGINQKDLAGKFIPTHRTFNEGKCIFLSDKNLCKIHKVKPKHARNGGCYWPPSTDPLASDSWKGDMLIKEFGIDGKEAENKSE